MLLKVNVLPEKTRINYQNIAFYIENIENKFKYKKLVG